MKKTVSIWSNENSTIISLRYLELKKGEHDAIFEEIKEKGFMVEFVDGKTIYADSFKVMSSYAALDKALKLIKEGFEWHISEPASKKE